MKKMSCESEKRVAVLCTFVIITITVAKGNQVIKACGGK